VRLWFRPMLPRSSYSLSPRSVFLENTVICPGLLKKTCDGLGAGP
jgi:hypothetical protein